MVTFIYNLDIYATNYEPRFIQKSAIRNVL